MTVGEGGKKEAVAPRPGNRAFPVLAKRLPSYSLSLSLATIVLVFLYFREHMGQKGHGLINVCRSGSGDSVVSSFSSVELIKGRKDGQILHQVAGRLPGDCQLARAVGGRRPCSLLFPFLLEKLSKKGRRGVEEEGGRRDRANRGRETRISIQIPVRKFRNSQSSEMPELQKLVVHDRFFFTLYSWPFFFLPYPGR